MEAERNYGDRIRRTINLLNDAHVATYTIDAGGLMPESLGDPSLSGRDQDGKIHHGIDTNRALSADAFQRFSTHDALETIALDTGTSIAKAAATRASVRPERGALPTTTVSIRAR